MKINERLNQIFKNVKQKDISDKLEISQGSVSDLLKGKTDPSLNTLQAICREFNIDGNWLLLGIESEFLTEKEKEIIKSYRKLDDQHKKSIEDMINTWKPNEENKIIKEGNL